MFATLLISLVFAAAPEPKAMEWKVDGVKRTGLVVIPNGEASKAKPVVFAFHGHGGTAKFAARSFRLHEEWPEAIVVYLDGLPTKTKNDSEGTRSGWQPRAGVNENRDLKFFDVVLAQLKKEQTVDEKRIYATGHSNGGLFTYLLWAERPDVFAGFAPCAAVLAGLPRDMKPKPCLHLVSESDTIVPFQSQQRTMDAVRKLNQCEGEPTKKDKLTTYKSKVEAEFVEFRHDGGHKYPSDGSKVIVEFFQRHVKK
ncbi:MAG: alpha/beta hydrolase family esterase [Fimbriiglobus sp.]